MMMPFRNNPARYQFRGVRYEFYPQGRLLITGPLPNPFKKEKDTYLDTWTARLFVGLSVRFKPTYHVSDIVRAVRAYMKKQGYPQDSSYVAQTGVFTYRRPGDKTEKPHREKSCQVIIINTFAAPRDFVRAIGGLADHLAKKFRQDTIIVEIQYNGMVKGAFNISSPRHIREIDKSEKTSGKWEPGENIANYIRWED